MGAIIWQGPHPAERHRARAGWTFAPTNAGFFSSGSPPSTFMPPPERPTHIKIAALLPPAATSAAAVTAAAVTAAAAARATGNNTVGSRNTYREPRNLPGPAPAGSGRGQRAGSVSWLAVKHTQARGGSIPLCGMGLRAS
eukprot:scaffold176887_cov21-Tisochrysis_lutea.AAC.2